VSFGLALYGATQLVTFPVCIWLESNFMISPELADARTNLEAIDESFPGKRFADQLPAVPVEAPDRSRAAGFAFACAFRGHERPPCRQAGYNRRGRDSAAFRAADSEIIARFNLYYSALGSRRLTS